MIHDLATRGDLSLRVARWISGVFHPFCQAYYVFVLVGLHSAGWRGLWLGLLAATFVAGIPCLALWLFVRAGRLEDFDVNRRERRPLILVLGLVSVLVGVALLVFLDAPRQLLVVLAATSGGIVVAAAISRAWKMSIHAACAAGVVTCLALLGPVWAALGLVPVPLAVAWSRVHLGRHDLPQVAVGVVVGVLTPVATVVILI